MASYNFLSKAYLKGQFVPFDQANISVATHALHYGTAAFGGIRGILNPQNNNQTILYKFDNHAKRLSNSGKFIDYEISPEFVKEKIIEFINQNKPTKNFYIRPLIYISDLGISPRVHDAKKDFLIYGIELGDYLSPRGVSCCFSSWTRQEDRSFPLRGKITGAYITSSMAKSEAVWRGFDEAILMNSAGKVSEGSGMNLFMVRDGKIITPNKNQDILEGITRDGVIQVAKDLGYEVEEREVDKTELVVADEVFLTGTAAKVTPVNKIENQKMPEAHPITDLLLQKMTEIYEGKDPKYESWLTRIDF